MRPLCKCGQRPVAINYKKKGKTFYRSKCEACTRYGKVRYSPPKWKQAGYEQKKVCDKCGYKSKHKEQFSVYYVDGDMNNDSIINILDVVILVNEILGVE